MASTPEDPRKLRLSLIQKMVLIPKILMSLSSTFLVLVIAPFRGSLGAPQYRKHVAYHLVRSLAEAFSSEQSQYLFPSTDKAYMSFAEGKKFTPQSVVLADGTKGHWVGSQDAEKVLVYFHGGGYSLPCIQFSHYQFVWEIKELLNKLGSDAAVIVLSYDLAPGRQYPHQLRQAACLVNHLITNLSKKPSNIVFAGDSAGAHLSIALLSHMTHPHPGVPKIEATENFRGAALLSPWVTFDISAPSMKLNQNKDCLKDTVLQYWGDQFMGEAKADPYNQPLTASSDWWSALTVDEILIVAGRDELLIDDIREFAKKLEMSTGSNTPGAPAARDATNTTQGAKRKRETGASSRGVANLTPEQLERKRANDRDAQRAIRERTKNQIEDLERQVQELTSRKSYQELQAALREKEMVQAEYDEIRKRVHSVVAILQPMVQSTKIDESIIGNPALSSSTPTVSNSPQYDDPTQARHLLHPSLAYPTSKTPFDREGSASNIPDRIAHSTDALLSPASNSSRLCSSLEAPIPHHGRYSPMSLVDQSRENMRHGLDLGTSGEKLGLNFLLDGPQDITSVPSGHSKPSSQGDIGAIAHMCPTRNIPPSCPLDSILLEFLSSRQQLAAQGVPNSVVVGPSYPSVSSLLNPDKKSKAHPLTRVFADILGSFEMLSKLPEQVAVLYVMFLVMRWQISPTQENYDRVPDWITPRPSQLLTMHPIWVDYLPWPKMRDVLVRDYVSYQFQDFSFHYTNGLSLNWPYEPTDVLLPTPGSEELCINPVYERHLRDLNNWSLGPEFRKAFPALCSGVRIKPAEGMQLKP
ncbi:hypothetical protein FGG08_005834 [Glutinoglossum americanum]|uniref:Alpha/beta hydrolase fold-3 domain-containing protein n=1 Tax=Glutinoglossum americanum TaxID=1670608 RepID=A0A9P8I279_9PEZI|nr:hypothetical protein FGG08_005834 [Glutinoglossum americanum]